MKRWHVSCAAAIIGLFSSVNNFAGEVPVRNSDVSSVTLFRSGAEVTRTFSASIPAGATTLVITGLSPYLDPQTIRCEGSATSAATILNVSHRYDYTGPEKMLPEVARLQDSLDVLTRMKIKISSQISVYQEEQNLLLANKSVGGANTGLKTEDLRSMAAFYRERLTEIKDKMAELSEKDKQLNKKIQSISQQIEELKNRRNPPQNTSTILIEVSSNLETRASFTFSYFTTMASWSPSYDVKVEKLAGPVTLDLTADITQDTWEEWKDVKLTISTGNVSSGNNKPELFPWYLQFMHPVAVYDKVMQSAAPSMAEGAMPDSGLKLKEMNDAITTEQTSFAMEYEIGIPFSMQADGKPRSVKVKSFQLPASYKYHVIPKLDTDAFLVAHVTGWQELGLVPAGTSIYYQGAYVGAGTLDTRQTNDTLLISLGRDPAIQVKREKVKDVEGNKTIGGNRVKEYRFEISVKNARKESIQLMLSDQLPVSMDKEIEVKPIELSGAELNDSTGELKWDLTIAPGETAKKTLGFTVKFPKDKQVFNL